MKSSQKKMIILTAREVMHTLLDITATSFKTSFIYRKQAYTYLRKRSIDRPRFRKTLYYLIERGYVVDAIEGKERYLEITNQGRKWFEGAVVPVVLTKPMVWDRRWRIVLFDIPAKFTKTRNYFREHLKDWGFLPLQRSIYVYPFECHSEIAALIERFKLEGMVQYLVAEIIEGEEGIMNEFLNNKVLTKEHFRKK